MRLWVVRRSTKIGRQRPRIYVWVAMAATPEEAVYAVENENVTLLLPGEVITEDWTVEPNDGVTASLR